MPAPTGSKIDDTRFATPASRPTEPPTGPLPPWSPDVTPIEEMISKVKDVMRSIAARTTGAVYAASASGLHEVTLDNIAGWFGERAAYAMQQ